MTDFSNIGALYRTIGLNTPPEVLKARLTALPNAYADFDWSQTAPLIRAAMRLAKAEEVASIAQHFANDDPGFNVSAESPEFQTLASLMLRQAIDDHAWDGSAALAVATASFGGVRQFVDPELAQHAEAALVAGQRNERKLPALATIKRFGIKEALDQAQPFATSNDLNSAFPFVRKSIEDTNVSASRAIEELKGKLNDLIGYVSSLNREANAHWWLVGGWSHRAGVAYSSLGSEEAALRAGAELAEISSGSLGLASAPALFALILQKDRSDHKSPVALDKAVTSLSLEDRKAWLHSASETQATMSLVPICCAIAFSVEAEDGAEWKPRFARVTGIEANIKLSPVSLASQFYRERLLLASFE